MEISIYTWKNSRYIEEQMKKLREDYKEVKFSHFLKGEEKDYSNSSYILGVDMSLEELYGCNKLKGVIVPYTGLNEFPVEELKKRGISIEGTHAKARYVAEKGLSLLLGIMGRVTEYDRDMRAGVWGPRSGRKNHWESLFNKRIGLIGAGHIATEFMRLTTPFNPSFSTLDRGKRYEGITSYYKDLRSLAQNSDILFISLPLNTSTEGLIDKEVLSTFDGYLINVGRGRTIVEEDLFEALLNGPLKGAGIDVWYDYPKSWDTPTLPSKYPFHQLENLIMSPHVATSNLEDRWIYFEEAFSKLRDLLEKEKKEEV